MRLLSQNTKVQALGRAPLFEGLSKKDLVELARQTEDLDLPQGTVLCKEGEVGREFFVLVEGEAEVRKRGRKVATLGPGEMIGEIALVEHTRRTATVTAKTPVRCFVMTSQSFWAALDRHPQVERKVLRTLAKRVLQDSSRA